METKWKGSYTIEAVFIIPLCTTVVILLLLRTLFMRDVIVAERVAQTALENGVRYMTQNASLGKAEINYRRWKQDGMLRGFSDSAKEQDRATITDYVNRKMEDALWFADYDGTEVTIDGTNISVSLSVGANRAFHLFGGLGKRWFRQDIKVSENIQNLPNQNREIMLAWQTGMKTEGLAEILSGIQELIGKTIH